MKVSDIMSKDVRYIEPTMTLMEAARKMREMGCGFLPVTSADHTRLAGIVTDRDMAIRAVAQGKNPATTTVDEIKSNRVLYCFADDDLATAVKSMQQQKVYRLIVLDDKSSKQLCGILSLGDINRFDEMALASAAARDICQRAA